MVVLIAMMVGGMAVGYLLRRFRQAIKVAGLVSSWAVYMLLFTLGLSIGADRELFDRLPAFGLTATILTIGAMLGSGAMAWLFARFVLRLRTCDPHMVDDDEV
ncbi:MAG: hypothetical protein CSA97_01125 [Bacteroidetes bacterium]|nr:MAG: hypothetical protein CSA97_01125 [Bacteroidota bacterium]